MQVKNETCLANKGLGGGDRLIRRQREVCWDATAAGVVKILKLPPNLAQTGNAAHPIWECGARCKIAKRHPHHSLG